MKYKGLTSTEAKTKLRNNGENILSEANKISAWDILIRQVKGNFVILLLLIGGLVSLFVGEVITFYVILVVIIAVVGLGFLQEFKAEKAITALKSMIMPQTLVIRDGEEKEINSSHLVVSDIVIIRNGEKIPADCQILETTDFKVNESILTGESDDIAKKASKKNSSKNINKVFMGSNVVDGKAICKVIHTGMNTEFGKIAGMIDKAEKELPLQKKINKIAKSMSILAFVVALAVGGLTLSRVSEINAEIIIEVLILIIAISVSAFPEGFPMVLISTLASGAKRMANKNAIVNRMSIIETLGEVTTICTDKTGTITSGEMTARKVFFDNKTFSINGVGFNLSGNFLFKNRKTNVSRYSCFDLLAKCAMNCNDAILTKTGNNGDLKLTGSPTESALLVMAAKAGQFNDDVKVKRLKELSFNSERKMMSVLSEIGKEKFVFAKGAPEIILAKCKKWQKGNKKLRLTKGKLEEFEKINQKFNDKRYRSLALAYRKVNGNKKPSLEKDFVFLGFVAIDDPPRPEVKKTIKECKAAGIKIKMITGDNKDIAVEIANEIGLNSGVLTGDEISDLSDDELKEVVNKINVFARVKPEHKIRLVKALKENGEIVAMTGDGVNDAPAIKEAHIGIAMGKNGTDVSRETADLIIKDDNFITIIEAVREGRTIFNNIQKFVTYQLSCNVSELLIMFLAVLIGLPLPFLPLQILFMNLVTDNLPAITLGFNPPSLDIMKTKARKKSNILNKELILELVLAATTMGIVTLIIYYVSHFVYGQELIIARTTALVTLIFFQVLNAFNFRSFRYPMQKLPLVTNFYLIGAVIVSILATFLLINTPINHIFEVTKIDFNNWLLALLSSISIVAVMDTIKKIDRQRIAKATNRKKALEI